MSQIHIFALERSLRNFPDYAKGKSMFKDKHVNAVNLDSDGTWVVVVKNPIADLPPFETCIQLKEGRVVSMSCTCHQKVSCCHIICALFEISRKQIMSESDYGDATQENEESFQDEHEFKDDLCSMDDFVDDRSQATVIIEDSEASQHGEKTTTVQQEFSCSVCLEEIEVPVLFPCFSHNLCYPCAQDLFEFAPVEQDGSRKVQCPQCGERHFFKVKSSEELKSRINRSLKRIITGYNEERENNERIIQELKVLIDKYEGIHNKKEIKYEEEQIGFLKKENVKEELVRTPPTLKKTRNRFEEDEILKENEETQKKDVDQNQRRGFKVLSRKTTITISDDEDEDETAQSYQRNDSIFDHIEEDFTSKRRVKKLNFYDDDE